MGSGRVVVCFLEADDAQYTDGRRSYDAVAGKEGPRWRRSGNGKARGQEWCLTEEEERVGGRKKEDAHGASRTK